MHDIAVVTVELVTCSVQADDDGTAFAIYLLGVSGSTDVFGKEGRTGFGFSFWFLV